MQYKKPRARQVPSGISAQPDWQVDGSGVECIARNLDDAINNHRKCLLFNQVNRSGMRIMSADE